MVSSMVPAGSLSSVTTEGHSCSCTMNNDVYEHDQRTYELEAIRIPSQVKPQYTM